jgi:DNA-binding beta-propeller fold protein YncE
MKGLLTWSIIFSSLSGISQTVKTLPIKGLNGPNGFAINKYGQLFIANESGQQVVKVINDSMTEVVLTSDSPDALAFDEAGNLYVSNFYSGMILKMRAESVDTIAKGLNKPSDIKCDGKGNLFVSEYEAGSIKKIDGHGEITQIASGLKFPFGLAFDNKCNLYVASNSTGDIYQIDSKGTVSVFAQITGTLSYLAFSKKTETLYATCFTCHNIYLIDRKGNQKVLAGNGVAGDKDGPLWEAQFNDPNSIAIAPDGSLYISEFSLNRIRKITRLEN